MLKISDLAYWIKNFIIILMFRYEQPQKGRYRQFYQAGIEIVGEKNYLKDVEAIYLGAHYIIRIRITIYFENKLNWWWRF
ncbi:ATP phosphoribosyltransferase regulatory subunit [Mycoplasmopsis cynos]|nr:ATP phosphoribosyltransferase regulatory subunit [Mycoplasmopsis cynos]